MRRLLFITVAATFCAAAAPDWGFDTSGLDLSIRPGDNFFQFANGTYVKNLVIPPDQSRFGAFNKLRDLSESRTKSILESAAASAPDTPKDAIGKAGAFYKSFMDERTVARLGATPLTTALQRVLAVS